jgi:hypothetical protein
VDLSGEERRTVGPPLRTEHIGGINIIDPAKKKASPGGRRSPKDTTNLGVEAAPAGELNSRRPQFVVQLRMTWAMHPLPARHQTHRKEDRTQHQVKDMVSRVQQHGAEIPRPIQRRVANRQSKRCKRQIECARCNAEALRRCRAQEAEAENHWVHNAIATATSPPAVSFVRNVRFVFISALLSSPLLRSLRPLEFVAHVTQPLMPPRLQFICLRPLLRRQDRGIDLRFEVLLLHQQLRDGLSLA